jgi:hypothetical protein
MGKKSTKRRKTNEPIVYHRPLVKIEDRGIYRYAQIVGHETVTLTQDEFDNLSQPANIDAELAGAITAARNVAAEKIRLYLTPIDRTEDTLDEVSSAEADRCLIWHETGRYELRADGGALYKGGYVDMTALLVGDQFVTIIDVGDGPRWYALDRKPPDDVAVALAALRAIERMKAGGTSATFHAFRLGRLIERLNAMQHEAAALTGKKVRSGAARGHEKAYGTAAEKAAQREQYRRDVDVEYRKCGKKTLAYERVAKRHHVSVATIRRAIK